MKISSYKTSSSATRKRLCVLKQQAGLPVTPRSSCNRLILAAQAVAFLSLFTACADLALDAAVYEVDSAPRPTNAEIARICDAEDYASDACIEWAVKFSISQ